LAAPAPQRFGKYLLLKRLGAGGMAETWLAERQAQQGVRKRVVIKRILPHRAEQPGFVEMFIEEAKISATLSHANIAQVFDFGDVGGEYFIALEHVDGLPLDALMRAAGTLGYWHLPYPIAMLIAIDACKGLHHAHTRTDETGQLLGIVHRDVSPDNLVISAEGETKVLDFGVAKAAFEGRSETDPGIVKGKHLYMSPEQAVADPLDARSDVYAMGIVLYQMLCGARPYGGGTVAAMQAVAAGRYVPPLVANPDLPEPLAALLERALAFDRQQRTPSAQALQEELSALLLRLNARASNQWVKGFAAWVQGGNPGGVVGGMLEQWMPDRRARPVEAEVMHSTLTELAEPVASTRAQPPAPAALPEVGSRAWWWVMGLTAMVGAAAVAVLAWPRTEAQSRAAPPVVALPEPPLPELAPRPIERLPDPVLPQRPPPPDERPAGPVYEAKEAPVKFTLGPKQVIALDDEILIRENTVAVRVTRWPTVSNGNRPLSMSASVRAPAHGEDLSRQLQVWLATRGSDGALSLQPAPASIDRKLKSWVFAVTAHAEWTSTVTTGAFGLNEEFGQIELRPTKLLAPRRFTVHSLSASPAWTMTVKVTPAEGARAAPVLLYARSLPGGEPVLLDDGPLERDMAILRPGTHRLDNAWWLWVSQVGVAGQVLASVEIELLPAPPRPRDAVVASKGSVLPKTIACRKLTAGYALPGSGGGLRQVFRPEGFSFEVWSRADERAERAFDAFNRRLLECIARHGDLVVRKWRTVAGSEVNESGVSYTVDLADLTFRNKR
jgi:Protein kinase domain